MTCEECLWLKRVFPTSSCSRCDYGWRSRPVRIRKQFDYIKAIVYTWMAAGLSGLSLELLKLVRLI